MIFITTCILILAYMVMGKDVKPLLERVKNIDWRGKIYALMDKLRPWAFKAGRVVTRPLLQFYYVMDDDNTSTFDRVLPDFITFFRHQIAAIDLQLVRCNFWVA